MTDLIFDLPTVVVVAATFVLAGTVKGIIGLGLPTVSLGLLTAAFDLTTAMALLIVPSFVTNIWQAVVGGNGRRLLLKLWPFLVTATGAVWLGATALTRWDSSLLSALLGALLMIYSALNIAEIRFSIATRSQAWTGLLFGTANGILTGMTGSFVVPGVMYLQGIGLSRDLLVQAMGILFTASTVALALSLQSNSLLTVRLELISLAAVIPAAAGMFLGQRIRRMLSEDRFRQTFFISIFALGAYIIARSVISG